MLNDSVEFVGEDVGYMLNMKNVSFSYKNKARKDKDGAAQTVVFENVSYQFEKGKSYALFGASGSGKTTCLMLLGGLEKPDGGSILIDGRDIREVGYNKLRRTRVSYVFQDYQLFTYMTAVENVMAGIDTSQKRESRTGRRKRCEELLLELGISQDEMNRVVTRLSGGQQQRVAIARALVNDSDYILADEPTGNLDKGNTRMIMELLIRIAHEKNKCVIIVTHSDYVLSLCDESFRIEREDEAESGSAGDDKISNADEYNPGNDGEGMPKCGVE